MLKEKTEAEPEEESEDVFYDDLPPMDRKTERYLVQKFATLWLNRIRPGWYCAPPPNPTHKMDNRGLFLSL